LRGGERAAAFAGDEGGSEGGGQLGAGRETLNLKCVATLSGAACTCASPLPVATHLQGGARLSYVAATAAPLAVALHYLLRRHRGWRCKKGLVV
jgi:hypothetical protein